MMILNSGLLFWATLYVVNSCAKFEMDTTYRSTVRTFIILQ